MNINKKSCLDLLEGNFKGERLVVVGVEGALLDAGLLLLQSFSTLHQHDLHVWIYKRNTYVSIISLNINQHNIFSLYYLKGLLFEKKSLKICSYICMYFNLLIIGVWTVSPQNCVLSWKKQNYWEIFRHNLF